MRHCAFIAIALLVPLVGCDRIGTEQRTAYQLKKDYVDSFMRGIEFGLNGYVKAQDWDSRSLDLIGLTLETNEGMLLRAERAEIVINVHRDTLALNLFEVTSADPVSGELTTRSSVITPEITLGVDAIP
ncbi:MAG: hypothetical protein AAGD00_08410 [Planctomycetota bacterium]